MIKAAIVRKLGKLSYAVRHARTAPFYGFLQGHAALTQEQLRGVGALVGREVPDIVAAFETGIASLAGGGQAVSFAAARMGFFALMKALGIGAGDEVMLHGATCAVMVNAVFRAGAKPVYADIDPGTFGSSAQSIAARLTPKTRMIVAQHSFGIPCDIEPIVSMAKAKGVFLLEDCALTLGSAVAGVPVGGFGDAALISTDHSKPLSTLAGGLVVTRDLGLASKLRQIQSGAAELPSAKQEGLWQRLLFERQFCEPGRFGGVALRDIAARILFPGSERPLLEQDFGVGGIVAGYPYPARMPAFLAAAGIAELSRWPEMSASRKDLLRGLLDAVGETSIRGCIPAIYRDPRVEIVPLRLAWTQPHGAALRARLSDFIDVDWTWFLEPIVGAQTALQSYGYEPGSCPLSERLGPDMVNVPCIVPREFSAALIDRVRSRLLDAGAA